MNAKFLMRVCFLILALSLSALVKAQTLTLGTTPFSDAFNGTTIDTAKWGLVANDGTAITQNNRLIMTGAATESANWGVLQAHSKNYFPRKNGSNQGLV